MEHTILPALERELRRLRAKVAVAAAALPPAERNRAEAPLRRALGEIDGALEALSSAGTGPAEEAPKK